jgi:hypothetical protein
VVRGSDFTIEAHGRFRRIYAIGRGTAFLQGQGLVPGHWRPLRPLDPGRHTHHLLAVGKGHALQGGHLSGCGGADRSPPEASGREPRVWRLAVSVSSVPPARGLPAAHRQRRQSESTIDASREVLGRELEPGNGGPEGRDHGPPRPSSRLLSPR